MSTSNPYAAKNSYEKIVVARNEEPVVEVPSGTIDDVLGWVDGDPDRADAALKAEESGHKRVTLVSKLKALLNG